MSSLLKNSELTSEKADSIVSETLNNCDDGELYICLLYTSDAADE